MISKYFKPSVNYSSWADRFSSFWTFLLFIVIALVVTGRHLVGTNVSCYTPSSFTAQMNQYANDRCWSARQLNLYYRGRTVYEYHLSDSNFSRSQRSIRTLYQWLPVIIVCQTILFRLPDIILRTGDLVLNCGGSKMVGLVRGYKTLSMRDRLSLSREMANYLNQIFSSQCLKAVGVTSLLLTFVKVLFLVNALTQLILMDGYLSPNNVTTYGQHVIDGIVSSNFSDFESSPAFPREVRCYLDLNRYKPLLNYTLQCSIPVNSFNEQVCFFMWIWLLVVSVVAAISLVVFVVKSYVPRLQERYVQKYLAMANLSPTKIQLTTFTKSIIGRDGVLLLKMIGEISSDILVRDIVVRIWYIHYDPYPGSKSQGSQHPEIVGGYKV